MRLKNRQVDHEFVLTKQYQSNASGFARQLRFRKVKRTVADYFGLGIADLDGARKTRTIALARRIAMYLGRNLLDMSFPEIAQFMGNKSHSAIIVGVREIKRIKEENRILRWTTEKGSFERCASRILDRLERKILPPSQMLVAREGRDMKVNAVSNNIEAILRNTGCTQAALAHRIGVDQGTVSKWLNGVCVPDSEIVRILETLAKITSEKALLLGAGMMATAPRWYYLCARAPSYPEKQAKQAEQIIKFLQDATRTERMRQDHLFDSGSFTFLFSIISLAVPLPGKSKAFTFADDKLKARCFLILVNSELETQTQHDEILAEISAHIRPYIYNLDSEFLAKDIIIK